MQRTGSDRDKGSAKVTSQKRQIRLRACEDESGCYDCPATPTIRLSVSVIHRILLLQIICLILFHLFYLIPTVAVGASLRLI